MRTPTLVTPATFSRGDYIRSIVLGGAAATVTGSFFAHQAALQLALLGGFAIGWILAFVLDALHLGHANQQIWFGSKMPWKVLLLDSFGVAAGVALWVGAVHFLIP